MQKHSLGLKKLISQAPEGAMLKISRPVYKRLFKPNRVLRADQKSDVNQTVSVLANRSLHQNLMHSRCRGTTVPNVCLQALTLSLPSPNDFFTLSPKREPVHRLCGELAKKGRVTQGNLKFNRCPASSVGYVPVCRAGGRWFKSRPNQHSGPLNN